MLSIKTGQGRKRALLIGINYIDTQHELKGLCTTKQKKNSDPDTRYFAFNIITKIYLYICVYALYYLGCINDVHNIKEFLMDLYNFQEVSKEDAYILYKKYTCIFILLGSDYSMAFLKK